MTTVVEITRPTGSGLRRDMFRRYKVFFDGASYLVIERIYVE